MAKKYYDEDITLKTDWGGDNTTGNLPVSGGKVQKVIKESINSKVGYVGRVEKTGQGFYVLTRDEETFNEYVKTISDENPFGDLNMDGVNGRFDAPFNYKMNITLINPESGYKSTLVGSTGNVIKFKAETLDSNNTPQGESVTITFKIKNEGGVENTYTAIYDGNIASQGIEYNLDGKLSAGINTITITAIGMNTGISAMRRITYRSIDMYFTDKFNISKRYQITDNGTMSMTIGYDLKGVGKTKILWYFDGHLHETVELSNLNPTVSNGLQTFNLTESRYEWVTPGLHNVQMSMLCKDMDSGEEFQTPIYYREFIIEKTPTVLNTPFIVRKVSFDADKGFLQATEIPTIYNAKQFENVEIEYAAYYNGKSTCSVSSYIRYADGELMVNSVEDLPLVADDFSEKQNLMIGLTEEGLAEVILRANYNNGQYFESVTNLVIAPSDMNISTVTEGVVLDLDARGRSNNTSGLDVWEYKYTDEYGNEHVVTTDFSKNEYAIISTYDNEGNVIAPTDATEENTLAVDVLPEVCNEEYKYVKYNNEYYAWNREFDWSDTSGWHDNKLKLASGNAITINYKPFSEENLPKIKELGFTFEIEFETTNVYNDDAVICRICGNENFAPGIVISASGAELVISRKVVTEGDNAGYAKKVSTKYKAEENNRISFVITPDNDDETYRNRILSIYVNGELCGAYAYDNGTNFFNDSNISFRGNDEACINISSIKIYNRALSSNDILNNYIYYRVNAEEKAAIYKRNDIVLTSNTEMFDSDKLKSQLPVMMIYQTDVNQSLDDIHQEKKNKKLTRFFDVVYIDIQNPSKNFLVKNAYVTPQGTSSMNYPVKNLRLYTGKKDKAGEYYSRLFVGSNIFIDGSPNNLSWDNINLDAEVKKKRQYAFKEGSIPVNCWCLKADFAESSSSHNTGTSRYWNQVLKNAGLSTKAQIKAAKYAEQYPYDVRTAIDGFPIVVFYQALDASAPRFEGKYNFNNDKSTEAVFGFTGGIELDEQEVKYYYIGTEKPVVHGEKDTETGEIEWACEFESGAYTETPTVDSPLYASKILDDGSEEWYMLRGKELLDNPKMECWELLNSVNSVALFETMRGFALGDSDEKIGYVDENGKFQEAFESRYPDCGDYYHYNSLKRFGEWLVSCRYLDIDDATGMSVPFKKVPDENYYKNSEGKLSICSLTKQKGDVNGEFIFDFPGYNFYKEIDFKLIESNIKKESYQEVKVKDEDIEEVNKIAKEVDVIPTVKDPDFEYLKCDGVFYTWMPSNLLETDTIPEVHEVAYDYIKVGDKYYVWSNKFKFADFYETQWVDDTAFNRALKFAVEKYDHIEMNKMAAYYIYLMRFGGVDQTVKNSMLTTEGPATDDANSTLPSLWYFINYDNDTILGVKNDGRLVFDPYITRETKDGTGYVYAGRTSTLWNNLEADVEFMDKVTTVDNQLADAEGGANPAYTLSYANALREYDTNQSDKWCERIYNKDAERKYIDTYVKGWTQKFDKGESEDTHVYEDYLYDVQGSRSAHRKWWLGRRFNVFDSRFCNANFRNQLIKFRSTNLPAGSSFTITSGEPIFYAWGHDNSVSAMTPTAIQPGNTYTWTTSSAFNIGSYLELMGAANISTLDLRNCVGALTEIDITGCYSPLVGTKMKEVLIGNHERTDLINVSSTSLKFSGLANASKLEVLDVTNIQNADRLDGLNSLLNIREVYAKGTSISNFTFADGAMIEKIELPSAVETLSLTRSSSINYDNIIFDGDGYGKLTNLTIDNCAQLMTNPDFVLDWILATPKTQRKNLSLNLQGINWTFTDSTLNKLFLLEEVGLSGMSSRNIRGNITLHDKINNEYAVRLQNIFGVNCFKEGSKVYINAPSALYINLADDLWEGDGGIRCDIIGVGTSLDGTLTFYTNVKEKGLNESYLIENTNGNITVDDSTLNNGYVTYYIKESVIEYEYLYVNATYTIDNNKTYGNKTASIKKRSYPTNAIINTVADTYSNTEPNNMFLSYTPNEINDTNLLGRGIFTVDWSMIDGTSGYEKSVRILNKNGETAQIQSPDGWDGVVTVQATITRTFDNSILVQATKELIFKNPNTIITADSNKPLFDILVKHNIIQYDPNSNVYPKLTKADAREITMDQLIDANGKSIFAENTKLESFVEFEWFVNESLGRMPVEGRDDVYTPDGMFAKCTNLREIALPDTFKYSANNMFDGCTNLEAIYGASQGRIDEKNNLIYTTLSLQYVGDNFANNCKNLVTCKLSSMVEHIGATAFMGCNNLTELTIPSNSKLKLIYTKDKTPFSGCYNITFKGTEYGSHGEIPFCVKDGACYEIRDDGTLTLIHMGKNTSFSSIPTDKLVYAAAYSMENRTEQDIVVPANVMLNGYRIFNNSTGNSITLMKPMGDNANNCWYLFATTKNYTTYKFADGETYIPNSCFNGVTSLTSFNVPEGIIHIQPNAFANMGNLTEITFPSTLKTIGSQIAWQTRVENITFKSEMPPKNSDGKLLDETGFRGARLENVYVLPEYYSNYKDKNNLPEVFIPFVTPIKLHAEGYVRIIKDGAIYYGDAANVITVGNIALNEVVDDYMKYTTTEDVFDTNVYLNNEKIGQIFGQYTTIYLGDNSMLFSGDGYNFRYGVYDEAVKADMLTNGWVYDSRFEGLRSINKTSELILNIPSLANVETNICHGFYAHSGSHSYIKDSDNNVLLKNTTLGYNLTTNVTTNDGILKVGYVGGSTIVGADGMILHEIGNVIYTDPELSPVMTLSLNDEMDARMVTITLSAPVEIPNSVYVTLTDGKAHTYRKFWNGEPLTFVLPQNGDFIAYTTSFITENGKMYFVNETIDVTDNLEITFACKNGIELTNNILAVYTNNYDWYVNLKALTGKWSENVSIIDDVTTNEIIVSDADGFKNTKIIANVDSESIFAQALKHDKFENGIVGYIPSFIEIEMFKDNLTEINEFLKQKGKPVISLDNIWTSEAYDANNAWTSDGEIASKQTELNYYIFGKKITL